MKLAFAPLHNTEGKRDADEFRREAQAFMQHHGEAVAVRLFDNRKLRQDRFMQVREWIIMAPPGSIDALALFCHGLKDSVQIGATLANVGRLADALKSASAPMLTVALYCCSTARDNDADQADDMQPGPGGEGGMADALRDALRKAGVQATIYAHATAGHTTRNPWVRVFPPDEVAGGEWMITPHSELWLPWVRALRGDLRFRFPFMSRREVEAELRGSPGA